MVHQENEDDDEDKGRRKEIREDKRRQEKLRGDKRRQEEINDICISQTFTIVI